jgi:hypothetical protein
VTDYWGDGMNVNDQLREVVKENRALRAELAAKHDELNQMIQSRSGDAATILNLRAELADIYCDRAALVLRSSVLQARLDAVIALCDSRANMWKHLPGAREDILDIRAAATGEPGS